ncbi:MAG: arginine-tRNA-protein transferase [Acidobacteria bacterium]|jgi:arginine-tRNA-protein transferase|nr:arginine-tRNA-protein transferase [Acidobacteriota bacterium]
MFDNKTFFINEEFYLSEALPREMDAFWANGWRHFGENFFRYNLAFYEKEICAVLPLRIRLSNFTLSKSQRRILKKNQDLQTMIRPAEITPEKKILFKQHKQRFKRGVPDSIYDFLSFDAAHAPCEVLEVCVYAREKLLAVSFFAIGEISISSIYAMFALEESPRSLGIFTILLEIDFAQKHQKKFYYQGYAYTGNSFYDYKKRFAALEQFNWNGQWQDFQS